MLLTMQQQIQAPKPVIFSYGAGPSQPFVKQEPIEAKYSVLEMDPEYQIEARDPLHHWAPKLNDIMAEFKRSISEKEYFESDFFDWVKENKATLPRTQYLSPAALEEFKQKLTSKFVLDRNGEKHTHSDVNPIMKMFVMDPMGDFYVHEKQKPVEGKPGFNHSSFFSGAPVAGVGFMHFNQIGELVAIDDYSGHYKPGMEQVLNVMHALQEKGFDLSKIEFKHRISQTSTENEVHIAQTWYEENRSLSQQDLHKPSVITFHV
jgi:hypothetical protein